MSIIMSNSNFHRFKGSNDCGSDEELLIAKIRLKLKKVGKTTRPFRYDLNQILCDYTREVTKSDRQTPWRSLDRGSQHCIGGSDLDQPQEKETQKGKMVVWRGLTNSWKEKRS